MTRSPGVGSKLAAFLTRDVVALVAGVLAVVAGVTLLIAPRLPWLVDRSFDLVEGTMTVSATGRIDLSAPAQQALGDSDALELGLMEMSMSLLLEPVAGMLSLAGVLVIVGGLLMLTTARQLGAVFAALGVVPQLFMLAIGILAAAVYSGDTSTAPSGPTAASEISVGAGAVLTLITYAVVLACALTAALRGDTPPPRR